MQNALFKIKNRTNYVLDRINFRQNYYNFVGDVFKIQNLYLLNKCWSRCATPDEWKTAKAISILKKGPLSCRSNFTEDTLSCFTEDNRHYNK